MINLSKRLQALANLIDDNSIIADIGCDHALLDIYLIQSKKIKKSIACDITNGALNQARKNIDRYSIKGIELRLSDGLNKINNNDKVNTIILSGLGDTKIINILNNDIKKLKNINTIIIQSNTGIDKIRKYVNSIGYYIENEILIKERNIIYTIIKFKKKYKKYSKQELTYGPILLKEKNNLFKELLNNQIDYNNKIINKLTNKQLLKKIKLKYNNEKIKQLLKK